MRSRFFFALLVPAAFALFLAAAASSAFSDEAASSPAFAILYPKHQSVVGKRVNIVLDPATDWSKFSSFQVAVGATEHPAVDASGGRHALQGVLLAPGMNTITIRAFAPAAAGPGGGKDRGGAVFTRTLAVFSKAGSFASLPATYAPRYFHTSDQESACSGCHRLEVEEQDYRHAGPEKVLCHACHREVPTGRYIHGPAAVWNCLGCHDPGLSPVKYQFSSVEPWTVVKTVTPARPPVFTVATAGLFKPMSAVLLSDDAPQLPPNGGAAQDRARQRDEERAKRKQQQRALFQPFLDYMRHHPKDHIRVEVHTDPSAPAGRGAGRPVKGSPDPLPLTAARAQAVVKILQEYGVAGRSRIVAVGMGGMLPKTTGMTNEEREQNERIEIVVHPPDMKVVNSMNLPQFKDRDLVALNIAYSPGAAEVTDLKVVERLPRGLRYVDASGVYRRSAKEPRTAGGDLVWTLGNLGNPFEENLSYVVRREPGVKAAVSPVLQLRYRSGGKDVTKDFDTRKPPAAGRSVPETCQACHAGLMTGAFQHGPAGAGYCTLCHDPHASNFPAWVRKQSWIVCTTCHAEMRSGVHLIAGIIAGASHPTTNVQDPRRPGKFLSCVSCHSPHSADTPEFLAYGARSRFDLCRACHPKK